MDVVVLSSNEVVQVGGGGRRLHNLQVVGDGPI